MKIFYDVVLSFIDDGLSGFEYLYDYSDFTVDILKAANIGEDICKRYQFDDCNHIFIGMNHYYHLLSAYVISEDVDKLTEVLNDLYSWFIKEETRIGLLAAFHKTEMDKLNSLESKFIDNKTEIQQILTNMIERYETNLNNE